MRARRRSRKEPERPGRAARRRRVPVLGRALGVVGVALALGTAFVRWCSTDTGSRWMAYQLERGVSARIEGAALEIGTLSVGRRGFVVDDVVLRADDGRVLLGAGRIVAELDAKGLFQREVHASRLRADALVLDLTRDAEGVFDIVRVFGGPSASPAPFRWPVNLDLPEVEVHGGSVRIAREGGSVVEVAGIDGTFALEASGDHLALSNVAAVGQLATPGPIALRASGDVLWDATDGLALTDVVIDVPHGRGTARGTIGGKGGLGFTVDRLEARALDPLTGDIGIGGVWSGSIALAPAVGGGLHVTGGVRGIERSTGAVALDGTYVAGGGSDGAPAWSLVAELDALHVEHVYTPLERPVVLHGVVRAEGEGTSPKNATARATWRGGKQVLYGTAVDRVDASLALADGTLSLVGSELDGIVGDLVIDGSIDLVDGPIDLGVEGTLSGERLAALGTAGLDGRGTVTGTLRANWKDPIPVEVHGTARYAPFLYGDDARASAVVAPFSARVHGGRVEGTVALEGDDVTWLGIHATSVRSDGLAFTNERGHTTVTGPVTARGATYADYVAADRADVGVSFATGSGHRSVDTQIGLVDYTLFGRPGTHGVVHVGLRDDDLRYRVALDDGDHKVLTTSGAYDVATADLVLDALAYTPTERLAWTSRGTGRMRIVDGGVADAELALDGPVGAVELHGALGTAGALDGRVSLEAFALDALAELWPDRYDGLSGTIDAAVAVTGDAANPTVDGAVDLRTLFVEGSARWLDASGPIHLEDHVFVPTLALAVAGTPLGDVSGRVPLVGPIADLAVDGRAPAELALTLAPGKIDRLAHLSPALDGTALPPGRFSARIDASGPLADPVVRIAGVSELDVLDRGVPSAPARVEFDVTRRASELAFDADVREGLAARASVTGHGTTRLGEVAAAFVEGGEGPPLDDPRTVLDDMTIATALVGVPAATLSTLFPLDGAGRVSDALDGARLGGDLVGGFTVTGSPVRPIVDGAVNWLSPVVGGQTADGAYLAIVPRSDQPGYDVEASITFQRGGGFEVRGLVPADVTLGQDVASWFDAPMDLTVGGDGLPLALATVVDPRFRDGEGVLALTGRVGGTPLAPLPALTAVVKGGRLSYSDLGVTAEDIDVRLDVTEDLLRLDHADLALIPTHRFQTSGFAEAERPRMHATGSARVVDGALDAMTAKVTLSDAPWISATENLTLRTQGEVLVSGAWPRLQVTGGLDLVYGKVLIDAARFFDDRPLKVDPAITVVRGALPPEPPAPTPPAAYAEWDVDVGVDLKRNLELALSMPFVDDLGGLGAALSRADVASRLGGKLRVEMRDGEPTLIGTLDVVDGKVRLLRSSLDLDEGTIAFAGGDPYADAILDLAATMEVTGGELGVDITGTPEAPVVEPHSEAYPDLAQQWTILLTGQAPEDLTADEAQATEALAGMVLSSLFAGRSLGTLSIEPDGSVRVGVPLAPTVFAASTLDPMALPNENSLTLELEWSIVPRVVASAGVGNRVQRGDLYWEIRF